MKSNGRADEIQPEKIEWELILSKNYYRAKN